jgi:hypothetical protein
MHFPAGERLDVVEAIRDLAAEVTPASSAAAAA